MLCSSTDSSRFCVMVIDLGLILVFLLANFISIAIGGSNSTLCKRTCGTEHVSYPFGFSDGCEIPLECSRESGDGGGEINLAGFRVRNLTSYSIMVRFPAKCDRKVNEIEIFNRANYAVSWENALLLRNCSSPMNRCTIPTDVLEKRFQLHGCDSVRDSGNVSCFADAEKGTGILTDYYNMTRSCEFLISSVVVDSSKGDMDVSLQFQTIQLEWWLLGKCNCSDDAECINVRLKDRKLRHRCSCKDGFTGDGFAGGSGCHKVSKGRPKIIVLIGGILAGASAVGLLFLICYFARRRSNSIKIQKSAKHLFSEVAGNLSVLLYPYKEIERATNGFSEQKRLGTGAYGTVYEGKLHNNECVAIKKIKNRDTNTIEQVMNEIKLISSVSHPNLVRLLGCCIENGEQILVYEFMENGTLCEHLQREKGKVLPWNIRLAIASETAQAIAYLHSTNPPIYHRDIKSSNILLDYNFNSKVADFGLSRLGMAESSHISTAPQGTPGYVDPEYHQNYHLSDKSDVYSFGVVLVEIITSLKVVDFSRPHTEINLAALAVDRIGKGRLDEIIDPSVDPNKDAWTLCSIHKVAELAFRCLAYHRDMRPSMMEVAEELEIVRLSGCPLQDDMRSVASCCSSTFNASDRSLPCVSLRNGLASQRLALAVGRESSPVSVQDPWLSANSSPSTHSLLGNVVK